MFPELFEGKEELKLFFFYSIVEILQVFVGYSPLAAGNLSPSSLVLVFSITAGCRTY